MTPSEWQPVHGTLMTSDPIEAYGGVSFPVETLQQLAQQINTSGVSHHVDHNLSKPIRMRGFEAFVESRDDGIHEIKFRAEIHEGDRHWLESHPGVSATITTPLARDRKKASNEGASMRISADHAWFDDDALIEAEDQFITQGVGRELIQVERAYQFSFVPDPQIFVEVVYPFLLSIGSSAVWDGIKKVFGHRRTPSGADVGTLTSINMSVVNGDRSLNAVVTTSDEVVAQRAMESLDQALTSFFQNSQGSRPEGNGKSVTVWNDESRNWTPPV
ncbi:hypothetical protein [Arthrobacter bambusae]|uniref:hypothetical protein n=1 Tax=Arthrobacter bambusae TaxID=1338426 RepID=UPI00278302DE|nr:hypothetical protein [Arthrobacter bambusae]MDQ0212117.1 hypothetical protein [Arthrobacter bambusae]MDQ0236665.1 hypothetical protein [Arthrobacter bambusae]